MKRFRIIFILLIIILASLLYYSLQPSPSVRTQIRPPGQYNVVEMNTRLPSFKLATMINGTKPYADGDRAQEKIVDSLQLVDRCRKDQSIVVVDVGAFLGTFLDFISIFFRSLFVRVVWLNFTFKTFF